jgi:Ca2+-binding EF-hand superfamily protein
MASRTPSRPATDSPSLRKQERPGRTLIDNAKDREERMLGLFRKFDTREVGILDINNIHSMVKAIMIPTDQSKRRETKNVASVILQSLDKDKSGGVDSREFIAWVTKGAELKPDQRLAFKDSGRVQASILQFLEAVEDVLLTDAEESSTSKNVTEIYTQDDAISDVVNELFRQFDVDQDGHIERDELCAMLMEVCLTGGMSSGYEATYDAAAKVLNILDTDGSGSIEPNELSTWVREGMTLSPEQRRNFSRSSQEKTSLIRFLSSMEELVQDQFRAKRGPNALLTTGLSGKRRALGIDPSVFEAVSKIFKRYDVDGSGAIDTSELSSMIQDLNEENNTLSNSTEYDDPKVLETATSFVMANLCENKERLTEDSPVLEELLTLDAFCAWVVEGMKLTPSERKSFARSGTNKAVLIRFLRTVEDEIATPVVGLSTEAGEVPQELNSYDSQLRRAIQDVFNQYDSDGSGGIDLEELSAMITEVQIEEGVPASLILHEQSVSAAKSVLSILTKGDPNPKVDLSILTLEKFQGWLLKGLSMTAMQRKTFAKVSPMNAVLARFLRAVERLARQYTSDTPLSRAVRSVFVQYDVDGSGLIDETELSTLMIDLIANDGGTLGIQHANEAARQMMNMLSTTKDNTKDNTKNNIKNNSHQSLTLSEESFLGWVHKGSQMPGPKRRSFAKGSEARRAMILLLRTVEIMARQEVWSPRKKILHILFSKYDADGSGHIDTGELSIMMTDLVNQLELTEAQDCAEAVVKHLDSSNNGLLEEEEFFAWLENGLRMSMEDRLELRKGGDSKSNLVKFLEGVERVLEANGAGIV